MRPCGAGAQRRVTYFGGIQFCCVERHNRVRGTDAKATQHGKRNDPRGAASGHREHQQQRYARPHKQEHCGNTTARIPQHNDRHQIRGYIHNASGYNIQIATDREIGGIKSYKGINIGIKNILFVCIIVLISRSYPSHSN